MTFRKTLFIQLKMLGDILMLTPAIKAFKRKYPDAVLDVAVQPPGDQILKINPYVDNVIRIEKPNWYSMLSQIKLISHLRKSGYDLTIDFLGNPRSAHYTFFTGAELRIGYDDARFKYAYNRTYKRIHGYSAISKLEYLDFLGIDKQDYRPEIHLDPSADVHRIIKELGSDNLLAISPVSLRHHKVWPTAKFVEAVKYLKAKYRLKALVIAGPGEKLFLDAFKRHATFEFIPLYIDDLMQLAGTLGRCKLFFGNDNGPKHFAVAMHIPTFTIYSDQSDPACWEFPDLERHRFIGGFNRPDSRPINEIEADKVIEGISALIDDLGIFKRL